MGRGSALLARRLALVSVGRVRAAPMPAASTGRGWGWSWGSVGSVVCGIWRERERERVGAGEGQKYGPGTLEPQHAGCRALSSPSASVPCFPSLSPAQHLPQALLPTAPQARRRPQVHSLALLARRAFWGGPGCSGRAPQHLIPLPFRPLPSHAALPFSWSPFSFLFPAYVLLFTLLPSSGGAGRALGPVTAGGLGMPGLDQAGPPGLWQAGQRLVPRGG